MNFPKKFWRIPALALVITLPIVAACADDEGALRDQPGQNIGSISGRVTNSETGEGIVGALVGTSPATATALTDANGDYRIENIALGSYAVTASKEGFGSASATTTLTSQNPSQVVNLQLVPGADVDTEGDLNVLVVRRTGEAISGATVVVSDPGGAQVATATTDANGFAMFTDLPVGSYSVTATVSISGIDFRASGGVAVRGGETAFLQLTLTRDFDQSVFPNIDGEPVELTDAADIRLVPVPGSPDDDPTIDCNIIRTQHMFIAEVVDNGIATSPNLVSGVKVEWDLNISTQGICEAVFEPFRCEILIPGNTGTIVDSDDPDLDPAVARTGLTPAFNVDSRKAVTFTNDGDQAVSFGGQAVTVGQGQTWIVITSPVEGVTDVIVSTPDIPVSDPDCFNNNPDQCDKEFAIKRWVNWATAVAELDWDGQAGDPNLATDPPAEFNFLTDGQTLTNVLDRTSEDCALPAPMGLAPAQLAPGTCGLGSFLIYAEVDRLRSDSPFTLNVGTISAIITDDSPDIEIFGENAANDGPGEEDGIQNVADRSLSGFSIECDLTGGGTFVNCDDQYVVNITATAANRDSATGEFHAPHNFGTDAPGWVVFQMRLNPEVFFCIDGDLDGICQPGADEDDSFSPAYQALLDGTADNTNTIVIRFRDEFGEICGDFTFDKEWVTSRIRVIKSTPDAVVRTVTEANGGPDVEPNDTPRPVKTHTIQVGQEFSYTITTINDGEVQSENVRITDTLPRFGPQFDDEGVDDGAGVMRTGNQAFAYVTDRPSFDPIAVVYGIDEGDDAAGDIIDVCIRGDNGSVTGDAYVAPAPCALIETDVGTIASARAAAEDASADGDQVVWIQWFDDLILARQQPGGAIESEDTVEVTLSADEDLIEGGDGYPTLPGTWCDIATVTDGPGNLEDDLNIESFDADTLCHEVREALIDIRKTTADAVISAGAVAEWEVEIANNGSATLTNTVIVDTLDQALFDASQEEGGVFRVIVDEAFGGDTLEPDSRIFEVDIGDFAPTNPAVNNGFVTAYTVMITTPGVDNVFCNRVTVTGTTPAGDISASDIACVTTTVTIELDVANEDGELDDAGQFQSAKEQYVVGESGDDFVYQIVVTNQSAFAATNVVVVDEVAPNTGAIQFEALLATNPEDGGANPNIGSVSGASGAGFTWTIGTLGGGERAVLHFSAEALAPQNNVGNRVRLTADQLTGEIIDEEPTTVTSN